MIYALFPLLAAVGLVACMLLGVVVGHRIGLRHRAGGLKTEPVGIGVVESALFALFGLLIAFTFSGASYRYDARRMLIADEANAIGTAYLRIDLLPANSQPAIRVLFRRYVKARLAVYHKLTDIEPAQQELEKARRLQQDIWTSAVTAMRAPEALVSAQLLVVPALNSMFDITTTRVMAALAHPPMIIFVLLLGAGLLCSLMAGYEMVDGGGRRWFHTLTFILISGLTVYAILELEFPRLGFIRLDKFDDVLVSVLETMK